MTILLFGCLCAAGQGSRSPVEFEAASVKLCTHPEHTALPSFIVEPDRVTIECGPLRGILGHTSGLEMRGVAGPDWINTARYDIVATTGGAAVTRQQMYRMVEGLLEERLKMKIHREDRPVPAFVLSIAKGGLKIRRDDTPADDPNQPVHVVYEAGHGSLAGTMSIEQLIFYVGRGQGRLMKDMTGLEGAYVIRLDWIPEYLPPMARRGLDPGTDAANDRRLAPPSADTGDWALFDAMERQLGLKVTSRTIPMETLVVDQAVRVPTPN
jgi:uncharacterized protein (TIGR03435 family)